MPLGQTLADVLGGLVAINKGDPQGAQAFTGQGRQQLAAQRQNATQATELQHRALDAAMQDPAANKYLQEFLQQGLQNKQTQAVTQHTQAQVPMIGAQTQGQQLKNVGEAQTLESFAPYGGQAAAEFGEQQGLDRANIAHIGASTALTGAQAEGQQYNLLQQRALDMMAQTYGFENHQHMQDTIKQNLEQQQMKMRLRAEHEHAGATMFGHLFPNPSGTPSEAQRSVAQQSGFNIPEDASDVQKRQATQVGLKAAEDFQKAKADKESKRKGQKTQTKGGLSDLIQGAPQAQPGAFPGLVPVAAQQIGRFGQNAVRAGQLVSQPAGIMGRDIANLIFGGPLRNPAEGMELSKAIEMIRQLMGQHVTNAVSGNQ